jgi:type I restriction enzyme, S subunit
LGEVANFYSGNSLPVGEKFLGQSDGYLLLKVSDLNRRGNEEIVVASSEWSSGPGARAGTCMSNAVVFPKRGGAIATNKKRKLFRPAVLDPNLMAVAPADRQITIDYLFAWFKNFRLEEIASGSSVPQLNKQDLSPLKICVPPPDLQQQFTLVCQEILSQRAIAAAAAENTELLFSSLQSLAFSGQL